MTLMVGSLTFMLIFVLWLLASNRFLRRPTLLLIFIAAAWLFMLVLGKSEIVLYNWLIS